MCAVAARRTPELESLGEAIRALRVARGFSQETLAEEAGLHRTYVGSVERGERNVAYLNIRAIAGALDVRASELIARAESSEG